jgi:hypothetical protein
MTAQVQITNLQDTKVMKRMGLPLNTPIEQRYFSRAYTKHWLQLVNAHRKFMVAICKLSKDGPEAATVRKWNLVRRRLREISEAIHSADIFIGKLGGNVNPPFFKRDQDEQEQHFLASLLIQRAIPFVEFWQEAIVMIVDEGTALEFGLDDLPLWFHED